MTKEIVIVVPHGQYKQKAGVAQPSQCQAREFADMGGRIKFVTLPLE